jgi:hypothetical protein
MHLTLPRKKVRGAATMKSPPRNRPPSGSLHPGNELYKQTDYDLIYMGDRHA